jgi:transposase-like protein
VQYYGPELEQRQRQHLKPTNKSWRLDETYGTPSQRSPPLWRCVA